MKPIPKIPNSALPSDYVYIPLAKVPMLSRLVECVIIRNHLYPEFTKQPLSDSLNEQNAFRPTGSTTAAFVVLLHQLTEMLKTRTYVAIIAPDYFKAFDMVRHYTLAQNPNILQLIDNNLRLVCQLLLHQTRICHQAQRSHRPFWTWCPLKFGPTKRLSAVILNATLNTGRHLKRHLIRDIERQVFLNTLSPIT